MLQWRRRRRLDVLCLDHAIKQTFCSFCLLCLYPLRIRSNVHIHLVQIQLWFVSQNCLLSFSYYTIWKCHWVCALKASIKWSSSTLMIKIIQHRKLNVEYDEWCVYIHQANVIDMGNIDEQWCGGGGLRWSFVLLLLQMPPFHLQLYHPRSVWVTSFDRFSIHLCVSVSVWLSTFFLSYLLFISNRFVKVWVTLVKFNSIRYKYSIYIFA